MPSATIECQFCGKLNRVDLDRAASRPKCGECSKPLLVDRPVKVSEENFDKVIGGTDVPVVVDFYADWCGPCRMMAPLLDDIAHTETGKILIAKVDTDRSPTLSQRFNIRSIPYFARFEKGEKVDDLVGAADPQAFRKFAIE